MKTAITKQTITTHENGFPKSIEVTLSTWDENNVFVGNELVGCHVLSNADLAVLNASGEAALQVANASISSLQSQVADLQAQVADLERYRPFDPNVIRSEAFRNRLSEEERWKLGVMASADIPDPIAKQIVQKLDAYLRNQWKVLLDDPEVVGPIEYMKAVFPLNDERVSEILRPASREEAYTE